MARGAGDRTVVDDEADEASDGQPDGLPPEDIEAMRTALLDMLGPDADLESLDDRLAAMIARIVEPTAGTTPAAARPTRRIKRSSDGPG